MPILAWPLGMSPRHVPSACLPQASRCNIRLTDLQSFFAASSLGRSPACSLFVCLATESRHSVCTVESTHLVVVRASHAPVAKLNKLCPGFVGPFSITEIFNADAFKLKLHPQLKALHPMCNIDCPKPYTANNPKFASRPLFDRPQPEADADTKDKVFEVERIVTAREAEAFATSSRGKDTHLRKIHGSHAALSYWRVKPSTNSRRRTVAPLPRQAN